MNNELDLENQQKLSIHELMKEALSDFRVFKDGTFALFYRTIYLLKNFVEAKW